MNHQKRQQQEIIIFTRFPQPGLTKTRLIPELGAERAAAIQRSMTEQIVRTAQLLPQPNGPLLSLYFTGGSLRQMEQWLGPGLRFHEQEGADLGRRIMRAFQDARRRGSDKIVLIASDCPDIDGSVITEALSLLQSSQFVLGPTFDGGYYLVGMISDLPPDTLPLLFTGISWGTADVYQKTVDRAREAGLTISTLDCLRDIDSPEDLAYFHYHPDPQ